MTFESLFNLGKRYFGKICIFVILTVNFTSMSTWFCFILILLFLLLFITIYCHSHTEILRNANRTDPNNGTINNEQSLEEAKAILKELRNRTFTVVKDDAAREKIAARNASVIADGLKEQANAINERASKFNTTLEDLLSALKNIRKESGSAKEKSENASSLVAMAKAIDWKVC